MGYSKILLNRRRSAGKTQKEVANILRCSVSTISLSEHPYKDTKQLPSEQYLKRFVNAFGVSAQDKIELERQLLTERALIIMPPIVGEQFKESLSDRKIVSSGAMPLPFRKMLAADWKNIKDRESKKYNKDLIQSVIHGERLMARDDVIDLAIALKKDPEVYLFQARYITEEMLTFFEKGTMTDVIRSLNRMNKEDFDLLINIFVFSVEQYVQRNKLNKNK